MLAIISRSPKAEENVEKILNLYYLSVVQPRSKLTGGNVARISITMVTAVSKCEGNALLLCSYLRCL